MDGEEVSARGEMLLAGRTTTTLNHTRRAPVLTGFGTLLRCLLPLRHTHTHGGPVRVDFHTAQSHEENQITGEGTSALLLS